jgi:transcriptional regulator with XRE-family HTH domain
MTAAPAPLVRLAQYIERRIAELALEYAEVCRRAEISDETLIKIRKGAKARSSTYRKLERALQWEHGSVAAILAGGEPTPVSTPADEPSEEQVTPPPSTSGLSPSEALRHATSAFAQRLGLTADDLEGVFEAVRRDLAEAASSRKSEPVDFAPYGTPDLSAMVLEARLAAGLSLEDVTRLTAEAPGAPAGLDEGWLSRLENASLTPDEFPEYPQLDALAYALHLDPARVQEAAGVQFRNVHSVWSDDGQSRAMVVGEVSAEDRRKLEALMRMYRRAPKK